MKAKNRVLLAVGAGLLLVAIHAFLLWRTGPECLFVSGEEPFDRTRCRILHHMEESNTPSVAVAVAQGGKILWEEGFGFADLDHQVKASPETMYRVGLVTALFTATGVLAVAEQGLVDLDAPVGTYLGNVELASFRGNANNVTARRILRNRSGLPHYWHRRYGELSESPPGADETIRRYGFLATIPGSHFTFSSIGYSVLELVLENTSGLPFTEALHREVFQPLGLRDTAVFDNGCGMEAVASGYDEDGQRLPCFSSTTPGLDGGFSSAHDLARLGNFHLAEEDASKKSIVSPGARKSMRNEVDPQTNSSMSWFHQTTFGVSTVQVDGFSPGSRASLVLVPEERIVVAILANGAATDVADIRHWILSDLLPKYRRAHFRNRLFPGSTTASAPGEALPRELVGDWTGEVRVQEQTLDVLLNVRTKVSELQISGDSRAHVTEHIFWTGETLMLDGFPVELPIPETAGIPHTTSLRLWQTGDALAGYALAVGESYAFGIPAFIELHRTEGH